MRFFVGIFIAIIAFPAIPAFAMGGDRGGNGGNFIKDKFMYVGQQLRGEWAAYLEDWYEFPTDRTWVLPYRGMTIPFDRLGLVLAESNISVQSDVLVDQSGSVVSGKVDDSDSNSTVRKIILHNASWVELFHDEAELRRLVCHEMLRSLRVNDDGFAVCNEILPEVVAETYHLSRTKRDFSKFSPGFLKHLDWIKRNEPFNLPVHTDLDFPQDEVAEELKMPLPRKRSILDYMVFPKPSVQIDQDHVEYMQRFDSFKISMDHFAIVDSAVNSSSPKTVDLDRYLTSDWERSYNLLSLLPYEQDCIEKQSGYLNFLLDMSNQDPLAQRFRVAVDSVNIQAFELKFSAYPTSMPKVNRSDLSKEDQWWFDHYTQGQSSLHLGNSKLVIEIPMPDNDCRTAITSEILVDRLERLVVKTRSR